LCSFEVKETILARGHKNILATHPTTLEFTKSDHLSKRGDCIVAVSADKSVLDLAAEFKKKLSNENARLTILIEAGGIAQRVNACGSAHLTLIDPREMVVRRSSYTSDRTLAVRADKAAGDLSRSLVQNLRNPARKVKITLAVRA
jgi:hypothetical protein